MITLATLEGRWRMSRLIDDKRAGICGHFDGEAVWRPEAGGLVQVEQGTLTYGTAPPMQATRRYLWKSQEAELLVFFDDGRPFHTVPPAGEEALHDCPPDTYRVRYSFEGQDAFTTIWHVTGPRKDAVLTTQFHRAGPLEDR